MATYLAPVWGEIKKYLEWGLSVFPVRDKDDETGIAKAPFGAWAKYQNTKIQEDVLFELMDLRYNTTAVGIVGGKVSGNLLIIDVDSKYKPGIEVVLLKDIQTIFPDLFFKLRIHRSPTGGIHILVRSTEAVGRSEKLAHRHATPEEIEKEPKQKTKCFLETRGEGGYAVAPPAMGYSVFPGFDNPIPVISPDELADLKTLMKSYNEVIKADKPLSLPTKSDVAYYDTNPFEDFNLRCNPVQLMQDLGWQEYKSSNRFIWFTRPGKSKGVSLSWNHDKRFFYCFTASSELEEAKGYSPANLLAQLKHGGDKKLTYRELVSQGYGVIKPSVEKKIARQVALNPNKQLPANISIEAANITAEITAAALEQYPFGPFWIEDFEEGIKIDRELVYQVSYGLGFRLYDGSDLVRIDGHLLTLQTERQFYDELKAYIKEEDALLYKDICNAWEIFIERHGKFTITRLQTLSRNSLLNDTAKEAYKFFLNGVLHISATGHQLHQYTEYGDKLIWAHDIQQREFHPHAGGKYSDFLALATNNDEYVKKCVGWLAHRYKDETTGYIVCCTEKTENPKDGGGSGKNIFSKLFSHTTTYNSKPGSQVKYDEKFLNSWNGERIFCLSDIPKHFDFSFLKEMTTGEGLMKKLFKDEYTVPVSDMPKLLVQTNYGLDIKDGGVKRRLIIIEFTDFFTRCGGVDVHFGCHFPKGWSNTDWNGYDTYIAESIQLWIASALKLESPELSTSMWYKQFQQEYGQVASEIIKENIDGWVTMGYVRNDEFKRDCEKHYVEYNIPKNMQPSSVKINEALKAYCKYNGIDYVNQIVCRDGYNIIKKKWFGKDGNAPF